MNILYLTPDADRLFLVPDDHELPVGELAVVSLDGKELRVDPAAIAPFEITGSSPVKKLVEDLRQSGGKRIDEVISKLERQLGPLVGVNREREKRQRQEEYQRSATSAIADALREAGIEPLS